MYNKLIFSSFLYILCGTNIIFAMDNSIIKSGYRFLTPSDDKTSWNKINHNGELEPSGFRNLTPYGYRDEFEIEHIHGDQYHFYSEHFQETFSIVMPNIQQNIIKDMCKNRQEIYLLLFKNQHKPTTGHYIYPINRIKPNQETINPKQVENINQETSSINSQEYNKKLNETLEQFIPNTNNQPDTKNHPTKKPTPSILSSLFTLKNGIRITVAGIIIYLIYRINHPHIVLV